MSILAAIRREEKTVKKQLSKLQNDLIGLQSAASALERRQAGTSHVRRSACFLRKAEPRFQRP